MPIITPDGLPVNEQLQREGISVIEQTRATHQDIRPIEIAVLNLMPMKQRTEKQLARLLGHTALQVQMTLLRTRSHESSHESAHHLDTFYRNWDDIADQNFDGLIITGAPVEHLDFNEVDYWQELRAILDWARAQVYGRLYICWGAQAALQHRYGIKKHPLPEKAFGVYPHRVVHPDHPLIDGFDDEFVVPVSRHTEVKAQDVAATGDLDVIAESDLTGLFLLQDKSGHDTYMFNHPEYGKNTLNAEFRRDRAAGKDIGVPYRYFPGDDPAKQPVNRWRAHARILYANWLTDLYRRSPFNLRDVAQDPQRSY